MKIISSDTPIASSDRAYNYGDGVFTTLCVVNQQPELLSLHLSRLLHDATAIGLKIDIHILEKAIWSKIQDIHTSGDPKHDGASQQSAEKTASLDSETNATQNRKPESKYVLKVHVSGGEAGRGYSRDEANPALVRLTQHPYPTYYNSLLYTGVTLMCAQTALAIQPALAGIKHMNRLEQVLIKREINQASVDDALVCDTEGNVIECSAGNIFFLINSTWCTPSLLGSGVNGVARQCLLNALRDKNQPHKVGYFSLKDVMHAECAVITNALMKVIPVKSITFADGSTSLYPVGNDKINALQLLLLERLHNKPSADILRTSPKRQEP